MLSLLSPPLVSCSLFQWTYGILPDRDLKNYEISPSIFHKFLLNLLQRNIITVIDPITRQTVIVTQQKTPKNKNLKSIITILLCGLVLISCSKNEDNPIMDEPLITKINTNVFFPGLTLNNQAFNFEYDTNQKLTKKIGGLSSLPASTGFSEVFSDQIYTSLSYSNNRVTVENYSSSTDFTTPKDTKHFTLNSSNQITTKEIPNRNNYWTKQQNFNYVNNKLSEIKTTLPNLPYDANTYQLTYLETFHYDQNKNLIRTEYVEQQNGISKGEKVVRIFEDYDNAINNTKRLQLLDEFFYRSLSKNNFRKYIESHYYDNVLYSTVTTKWAFSYDSKGQIIIN